MQFLDVIWIMYVRYVGNRCKKSELEKMVKNFSDPLKENEFSICQNLKLKYMVEFQHSLNQLSK